MRNPKQVKLKIACIICAMCMCTFLMFIGVSSALNQTARFKGNFGFTATNTDDNVAASVQLSTTGAVSDINSSISFTAGEASQTKENAGLVVNIGANGVVTFTIAVTNTNSAGNISAELVSDIVTGTNYTVSAVSETGISSIAPGGTGTFTFTITVTDMLQAVDVTNFVLSINLTAL